MEAMKKIFVIHGWTYSSDKWNEFVSLLKEKDFFPVLLNVPGLTEKTDIVWTLNNYVEWLKNTVGNEKAIIVGHSNGGRIALAFAAKYPDRLKQLILIDSAGVYHNELQIRLKRLLFRIVAKLGKKITSSEKLRSILYKVARETDYKDATPQMRQTMANLIFTDITPYLNNISVPTLIIWGDHDKSTPLVDGEILHKYIHDSKLVVIKNAKHSPHFTHAKEVCRDVLVELEKL